MCASASRVNDMPGHNPLFASRWAILRAGLDPARQAGLEFGPLASPIFTKSEGSITYVDHADAETLRATYHDDPSVDEARIVDVDVVWGEAPLAAALGGARFDFALASHVAEHVPDLITWLAEVSAVLRPGGELRLALPDNRFSFDVLRAPTRITDLVANWVLRARRPQMPNMLDFRLHYAPAVDGQGIYEGRFDLATLRPAHDLDIVVKFARRMLEEPDLYLDVHCWVFHPRQFVGLMARLAEMGLLGFACAGLIDTAPPLFEFYVFLRPCADPAEAAASWRAIAPRLADPLPGSMAEKEAAERDSEQRRLVLEAAQKASALERLAVASDELAATREALAEARREAAAASAERAVAQRQIATMRASTSWRVTAPLRWLRRLGGV
jgi:SAM-dependent methyltransferase